MSIRGKKDLNPVFIRGFPKSDIINLDITIAKFVYPRLIAFKAVGECFPTGTSLEEWHVILDKMIFAMRIVMNYDNHEETEKCRNELHFDSDGDLWEAVGEGLDLFGKYFCALWT